MLPLPWLPLLNREANKSAFLHLDYIFGSNNNLLIYSIEYKQIKYDEGLLGLLISENV